jgi:protein tyrosine phosphatase (PTP) superfamily phosphohydrolase (DUF442 family)
VRGRWLVFFAVFVAAVLGVAAGPAEAPERTGAEHLPNALLVHPKVISGGQPEGREGFAELRELGVKTVISVDGAKPDVAVAKEFGLRYVHLPHGYDGIPSARAAELAKAVRDLPGPIYVHCHHGKHRSPAAAAVACVAAGLIEPGAARGILETAGTSEHYVGLYASAESARAIDADLLDQLEAAFPETAELPPIAEAMVEMERSQDRLLAALAAGWKSPVKHPDVDPAHEALLLREHFTELLRTDDVQARPERFRELLRDGEAAGLELEAALRGGDAGRATVSYRLIEANCATCHRAYRDVPLGAKP